VIAVDRQSPHLGPWHDPVANLVYAARGSDVRAVFVDGQPLVLDRTPVRLDAERILADATEAARALAPVAVEL
jgi:5-methylthioadenosine/S-adenosylhomocysteine deaminase